MELRKKLKSSLTLVVEDAEVVELVVEEDDAALLPEVPEALELEAAEDVWDASLACIWDNN
jgi:hypothetical protein